MCGSAESHRAALVEVIVLDYLVYDHPAGCHEHASGKSELVPVDS